MAKEGSTVSRPDGLAGHHRSALALQYGVPLRTWSTSSPTSGSSRRASPATRRSRSPSRSSTTSSAGSARGSCRTRKRSTLAFRSASRKRAPLPLRSLTAAGPRARRCPPPLSPLPSRSQLRSPRPRSPMPRRRPLSPPTRSRHRRPSRWPSSPPTARWRTVTRPTATASPRTAAVGARPPRSPLNLGATKVSFQTQADAPSCMDCGSIMVRNGSCYKCLNCGSTSGCS